MTSCKPWNLIIQIAALSVLLLLSLHIDTSSGREVLHPPYFNLAEGKSIEASSTCGLSESGHQSHDFYCSLGGASAYDPYGTGSYFTYNVEDDGTATRIGQLRMRPDDYESRIVQGGQSCAYCEAGQHEAENMVDGTSKWWQSPPLSRGFHYNTVNITINLQQEFHVAYVSMTMANSPRPGAWMLERSVDHGETWEPWQYFAESHAQCEQLFGPESLQPILDDDDVICSTEHSKIVPLENGQIFVRLVNDRPSRFNFSHSESLQQFTRATDVRIRLLKTKTLQGHLMDLARKKDPTITRRYFYSIKEIEMGGRCVCHGHASTCDILDPLRPTSLLCRCQHETCGDHCDVCCPGYRQKEWKPSRERSTFVCEPCNCFGHSTECEYDQGLADRGESLDIHSRYEGGGRCLNCQHHTAGINCNQCAFGYYRPADRQQNQTDACVPCQCDPLYHNGDCADETGKCFCKENFNGPDCDSCAAGYHNFTALCPPCPCNVNGTSEDVCLPEEGQNCPCKETFDGKFCDQCADEHYMFPDCKACDCELSGALNNNCSKTDGQCQCKGNYNGTRCDECSLGYYKYPECEYCGCDPTGTEEGVCDGETGQCLCKDGYGGERCDKCLPNHFGYPNCQKCGCSSDGSKNETCNPVDGQCQCLANFAGRTCDQCAVGHYAHPKCLTCDCESTGSMGISCDDQGRCYCKRNFDGLKCDKCKDNFYNFPICEECNCNPNGVSSDFAGCDKVPPGELCTCKSNVIGRMCDKCKPTFWSLEYHNADGCRDCNCYPAGSASGLNSCDQSDGQCICKANTAGRTCQQCAEGFYNLQADSHYGCQRCGCDVGGSFGMDCNKVSGQCHCKPRVQGPQCNEPIDAHYYPHLHHIQYEAEDGRTEGSKPVRMAMDEELFRNFSWKGFAVFSPIQEEIMVDVDIRKSNLYRILFRFRNPAKQPISAKVTLEPLQTHSDEDVSQTLDVSFPPNEDPMTIALGPKDSPHPFVLNPGRWVLYINTKQRLFLDYVTFLPSSYYEAGLLKQEPSGECMLTDGSEGEDGEQICLEMVYPKLPGTSMDVNLQVDQMDGLPEDLGPIQEVKPGSNQSLNLPAGDENQKVILVVSYINQNPESVPIQANSIEEKSPTLTLNNCPYKTPCRDTFVLNGEAARFPLGSSLELAVPELGENGTSVGIQSIQAVPVDSWNEDFLKPTAKCMSTNGKECITEEHMAPPDSLTVGAQLEQFVNKTESLDDYERPVLPLNTDNQVDIFGEPGEGHSVFMVHYFNPNNPPVDIPIALFNDRTYNDETGNELNASSVPLKADKANCVSLMLPYSIILDHLMKMQESLTAIPFHMYTDQLVQPISSTRAPAFLEACSSDNFYASGPEAVPDECKQDIFSLTVDLNQGAFVCNCNPDGSSAYECEKFGGQCSCRENIIGKQCSRCRPGYFDFPNCQKCSCGKGKQCHEVTGQCMCPLHVEGINCEKCEIRAYGYDPLIGCQLCDCHPEGSEGGRLECDSLSGQCLCKGKVGGRKCDECLSGFYGFPHCYQCNCETAGSIPKICSQTTSQCLCKDNVIGESCSQCKQGTFNLEETNPKGCSKCFCFGVTDNCQSSPWKRIQARIVSMGESSKWDLVGASAEDELTEITSTILEARINGTESNEIYFSAPSEYMGQNIFWYGGILRYTISSEAQNENDKAISTVADVVLEGNGRRLKYWSTEQPPDLTDEFTFHIKFSEADWKSAEGDIVSRAELMMVLQNVTALQIKASYVTPLKSAIIKDIAVDSVDDRTYGSTFADTAKSVELCQCPPPYTGSSCQECADGYYRVTEGQWLGACVPCQCNGHSNMCDKQTGVCEECRGNTHGNQCELCDVGHFGDPSLGPCTPCSCPYQNPGQNFALSCEVDNAGYTRSCNCSAGYSGDRCELCDAGYFGDPLSRDGMCKPCFCNENNDGQCDRRSGVCSDCTGNTSGQYCQTCAPWYHGDAVAAKNCTECECDQCGSQFCEIATGRCECLPLVTGENCERCISGAWGFSTCAGCQLCECGEASLSPECDDEGQCSCMEGVEGMRCDRCINGFWNYSPQGCTRCDCEADLSQGTVCDVNTGQCHCQEGATGPRCDTCLEGYLRVPGHGCLRCEACVHVLADDLMVLGDRVDDIQLVVGNVSTDALMGSRLKRINATVEDLMPKAEKLIKDSADSGLDNYVGSAMRTRDRALSLSIAADRALNASKDTVKAVESLLKDGDQMMNKAREKSELASNVVRAIEDLRLSISQDGSGIDREVMVAQATSLVEQLRNRTFDDREAAALAELEQAKAAIQNVTVIVDEKEGALNQSDALKDRLAELTDKLMEQENRLTIGNQDQLDALDSCKATKASPVLTVPSTIRNETVKCQENLETAEKYYKDAKKIIDTNQTLLDPTILQSLNESGIQLSERADELSAGVPASPQEELHQLRSHSALLERKAQIVSNSLGPMRDHGRQGVKAASAYEDINGALTEGDAMGKEALAQAYEALENTGGLQKSAEESETESMELLRQATTAHSSVINNVTNTLGGYNKTLESVAEKIRKDKEEIEELNSNPDSNDVDKQVEIVKEQTVSANEKTMEARNALENVIGDIDALEDTAANDVSQSANQEQDKRTAREQLDRAKKLLPEAKEKLDELQAAAGNASAALDNVEDKLKSLRDKVALARDMTNRIPVGVKFQQGSSLQLKNPPRIRRSASNTDISLYFKTRSDGLILFFGNEVNVRENRLVPTADYLALEVWSGRPKLVVNLGDDDLSLVLEELHASDGNWHRANIKRTGKQVELSVETDGRETVKGQKTMPGSKSVLNLDQNLSKIYVGGVPNSAKMPKGVVNRNYVGMIEDLMYHGTRLGLWNFDLNGRIGEPNGAMKRDALLPSTTTTGVGLNGEGYVTMKRNSWDPRKTATISMSFRSYSNDAALFYVGKEKDYLSLQLQNGKIVLQMNLGSGPLRLQSDLEYNDGEWHNVYVQRKETEASLTVDNQPKKEGKSPGKLFELGTSDFYYVGGVPDSVSINDLIQTPLKGCIDRVSLESTTVNLNESPVEAIGVVHGCPLSTVHVVQFHEPETSLTMSPWLLGPSFEFSLRFRTVQPSALLATIKADDDGQRFSVRLDDGWVVGELTAGEGNESDELRLELSAASDGDWHYVTVVKTAKSMKMDLDDRYTKEIDLKTPEMEPIAAKVVFGNDGLNQPFLGCLGDVTFDQRILDFSNGTTDGKVSLVGCSMEPATPTTPSSPQPTKKSRTQDSCALSSVPLGPREDSKGFRFGTEFNSRMEYLKTPEPFKNTGTFSVEFRTVASNGIILFASDGKNTDHLAVYLEDGHVVFSFNSGSGALSLRSRGTFMDGEWHRVVAKRTRKEGELLVDGQIEADGSSEGNNFAVDTIPPFYFGGIPPNEEIGAAKIMQGMRSGFSGCLRDLRLNTLGFEDPTIKEGVTSCSNYVEPGMYFGQDGGYAIVDQELNVGTKFTLQLEIKPRVENGILIAVTSRNSSDFLTLQIISGKLVFAVNNGGGVEKLTVNSNQLCDGQWHRVKIVRMSNILTMAVDGVSGFKKLKSRRALNTDTALYLGGVPKGYTSKGLFTRDYYVGCVREVNIGSGGRRRKRRIDLGKIPMKGDTNNKECPVN